MKLKDLIECLPSKQVIGSLDCDIKEIKIDSSLVNKGSLFVCLKGTSYDGHDHVKQVENYGGEACVVEKKLQTNLPQIIVKDSREALSLLSSNLNGNTHRNMKLLGVVGTNGKTTTTHFITSILMNSGEKCGLIGTMGTFFGKVKREPTLTTPDPPELYKTFAEMHLCETKAVVMEASAHAIFLKKLYGINFEQAIFTNFSQDHLDFFENMQNYKKAKLGFFNDSAKYIITNSDDEVGREILKKNSRAITYGIENPADVFAINIRERQGYTSFVMNLFDKIYDIKLNMIGRFNVLNALAASCSAALYGIETDKIAQGLENLKGIEGRLECVYNKGFSVYIDYAHTPDGLKKSLQTLKGLTKNKLICVFGCGGNRDLLKREIMGEISSSIAHCTILTSDNPRYEEPMEIIWQIEKGVLKNSKNYLIVQDRAEAIKYSIDMAKAGDVILVAGKGCEKYQEICGIKHLYNDKDTICEFLKNRGYN